MVGEDEGCGARPALAAVNRDEVDAAPGRRHQPAEILPEAHVADRRFEPHGQSRGVGDLLGEVEQAVYVAELGVSGRTDAVPAKRDSPDLGNLVGDFDRRENSAEPGFRALTHLDFDRADWEPRHRGDDAIQIEPAAGVARSEVPGAELPDEIPAVIVMTRNPAFTGVLHAAGELDAAIDRFDRGAAQRAVAHG